MDKPQDRPLVTYSIIIVNVLLFVIMMIYDRDLSYTTLVDFGAKVNFRIADFHFLNLFMPMFLHSSIKHITFNMIALYYFGPMIEYIIGKTKFLISYLTIGVLASIGSFIFSEAPSVGASGVIYGFMGLHLFLYLNDKERYLHVFGKSVLQLIAVNVFLSFMMPNIDIAGHFVGFAAGFAVYALLFPVKTQRVYKILSILIIIAICSGLFIKADYYKHSENYFISKAIYLKDKKDFPALEELNREYQKFLNQ